MALSDVVDPAFVGIRFSAGGVLFFLLLEPPPVVLLASSLATRHIRQEARGRAAIFCCGEATYSWPMRVRTLHNKAQGEHVLFY